MSIAVSVFLVWKGFLQAHKLSHDAWEEQWEEINGCEDYQACDGNYSSPEWSESYTSNCWCYH